MNPSANIRLTEDQRKQIYREIVEAEYKAMYEADQKYPALNPAKPSFSDKKAKRRNEKRRSLERTLTKRYVAEVAKKYGMTGQKVDQIQMEGETKSWPVPPWKHGPPSMEKWP